MCPQRVPGLLFLPGSLQNPRLVFCFCVRLSLVRFREVIFHRWLHLLSGSFPSDKVLFCPVVRCPWPGQTVVIGIPYLVFYRSLCSRTVSWACNDHKWTSMRLAQRVPRYHFGFCLHDSRWTEGQSTGRLGLSLTLAL